MKEEQPDEALNASSEHLAQELGGVQRVVFLYIYNLETQEIGLRPAEGDKRSYKVSDQMISSHSFYRHFGIKYHRARAIPRHLPGRHVDRFPGFVEGDP